MTTWMIAEIMVGLVMLTGMSLGAFGYRPTLPFRFPKRDPRPDTRAHRSSSEEDSR